MFRTGIACIAVLAAVTLSACSSDKTPAATTATNTGAASTSTAAQTSAAAQQNSSGDACTEIQYEIDLAHDLQQGKEPADSAAAIQRLSKFRVSAPPEIIATVAQTEAVIVGHLQHRGADQINEPVTGVFLDKLTQWKSAHC
ncbi:MAG: hypothetical protein JWN03_7554 [Nocardia sp.]|uniref:hypothetical protein n=1 Tax=Nocardia sp. TaxID=1821 RepID=UPI0026234137|nr:hypothetical protein [Nocardia sp.]MCU1647279.1 hypothetical protein [Nocardia sp.]